MILINTDTTVITDANGIFSIVLPEEIHIERETDSYQLTVSREGYTAKEVYYYPKSSPTEIRLNKK